MYPEKKHIEPSGEKEYASPPCYLNSPELRPEYKEEYTPNKNGMKPKRKINSDDLKDPTEEENKTW